MSCFLPRAVFCCCLYPCRQLSPQSGPFFRLRRICKTKTPSVFPVSGFHMDISATTPGKRCNGLFTAHAHRCQIGPFCQKTVHRIFIVHPLQQPGKRTAIATLHSNDPLGRRRQKCPLIQPDKIEFSVALPAVSSDAVSAAVPVVRCRPPHRQNRQTLQSRRRQDKPVHFSLFQFLQARYYISPYAFCFISQILPYLFSAPQTSGTNNRHLCQFFSGQCHKHVFHTAPGQYGTYRQSLRDTQRHIFSAVDCHMNLSLQQSFLESRYKHSLSCELIQRSVQYPVSGRTHFHDLI